MRRFLRDNGLTLVLSALFLASLLGHYLTGWAAENQDRNMHGQAALSAMAFLRSGQFLSSVFENWESEFLQMAAYVLLTAMLFQRGSPESKDPDKPAPQDHDPQGAEIKPEAPWPVRAGGWARALYAHSLGLAMTLLFLASFTLHWINSARHANEQAQAHGELTLPLIGHLAAPQLWFESFQNWQSEFLSTAVLVVLGIWLRQRGSPESKPVAAPHSQTGTG